MWQSAKFGLRIGAKEYRRRKNLHSDLVLDHFECHHVKECNNSQLPIINECGPLTALFASLSADNSPNIRSTNVKSEQLGDFRNDMVTRVRLERRQFNKDDISLGGDSLTSLIRLQIILVGRNTGEDNHHIVVDLLMVGDWKADLSIKNICQKMGSLREIYLSLKSRAKVRIVSRPAACFKAGGKLKRVQRK